MIVGVFLIGWLLGGLVANIITIIVQKAKYKVRINIAIEYITRNMKEEYIHTDYIHKMVSILKGDDKNENE